MPANPNTFALAELEQAAQGAYALMALCGVQHSGAGVDPEDFYTVVYEMAAQCTRRIDTVHRQIGGTGIEQ